MEERVAQAFLYDFYGELLNEHQRRIYEEFVFQDLSLGEIAEAEGISRQAVHDVVRRCTRALEGYEDKLRLVEKFGRVRREASRIRELAAELGAGETGGPDGISQDGETLEGEALGGGTPPCVLQCAAASEIDALAREIIEEL